MRLMAQSGHRSLPPEMSAIEGKADIAFSDCHVRFWAHRDLIVRLVNPAARHPA